MSDQQILDALRHRGAAREQAWKYMYKNWRGIWESIIKKAGGTEDEANEALNDVCMRFERVVTAPDFKLKHRLSTYLVTCVFNQWQKNRGRAPETVDLEDRHLQQFVQSIETRVIREDCKALLSALLERVGGRCKEILRMWTEGYSMEEIAQALGISGGAKKAKDLKWECLKKLLKLIDDNPGLGDQLGGCL